MEPTKTGLLMPPPAFGQGFLFNAQLRHLRLEQYPLIVNFGECVNDHKNLEN